MSKGSTTDSFFDVQAEKSKVKTLIVTEFFKAYFPIINAGVGKRCPKIYYIDPFSGPGYYDNGASSTPIVLLDLINGFGDDSIRNKLQVVFNDSSEDIYKKLLAAVSEHTVISRLSYPPIILNKRASEVPISDYISENIPCFSFVDPFGYIDVSASQIWTLVKNIGSDCVLFFNANRILQDISKPAQESYFIELFGDELQNAKDIQASRQSQNKKCEGFLKCFSKNLYITMNKNSTTRAKLFLLPFCVESDDRMTTSHYIVFITKSHKAIQEMKRVMLKYSNSTSQSLVFDSKNQFQISLFSRKDNLEQSIVSDIKKMFMAKQKLLNETFNVNKLMEKLDLYSMYYYFQVFPYSLNEVKSAVEFLDTGKFVEIKSVPNMKKRITQNREFKFSKSLLEG